MGARTIAMATVRDEKADPFLVLSGVAYSILCLLGDLSLFSGRTITWMVRRRL